MIPWLEMSHESDYSYDPIVMAAKKVVRTDRTLPGESEERTYNRH